MGGIPDCGAASMDYFQLKRGAVFLFGLVLAVLSCVAHAGFASAVVGGGAVKSAGGTWSVRGASATAANGSFITPATVTAAGKQVVMPASASFAANAASFAVTAVRLNPAGLVVGLTASWLLSKGLTYANNEWSKSSTPVLDPNQTGQGFEWCNGQALNQCGNAGAFPYGSSAEAEVQIIWNYYYPGQTWQLTRGPFCMANVSGDCQAWRYINDNAQGGSVFIDVARRSVCFSGYTMTNNTCVPSAVQVPATEADFSAAGADPLPATAAQELARANVPIPVDAPVLSPAPKVEDYGSPYVDPVTGKTVQTKTRITPDPTAADPYNVRIESYNVEVSPAPVPDPADPVPVPKDEQPKDPCLDNPNRIGCMDGGTPDDIELETQAVPFSVNPISVGGAGACPPDPVIGAHGFQMVLKLGPICDAAGWLRPLVLALAWFSAALIVGGAVRES